MTINKSNLAIKFTGDRPQGGNRLVIKTTLLHDVEINQFTALFDHPSVHLSKTSKASMSLVLRRALTLLAEHQKRSLTNSSSIEKERMNYLYLGKSGQTHSRVSRA